MRDTNKLKRPLESYTPGEVLQCIESFERCRSTIYASLGSGLCAILSPPPEMLVDADPLKSFKAGWTAGLEALLNKFPQSVNSFSLEEIIKAIHGGTPDDQS